VRGATIVFHDITELERDQRALRKTLLEQQAILENAAVGILFTKDATVQECNIRCAEMLGYSRQELEGGSTNQVFPSEAEFIELGRAAGPLLVQGLSFKREAQLRRKDGTLFWARLYGRAIDPSHTADGTIWIVEDINEHRIDEEKLRARCWSMQAIMDNAPLAIVFQRDTASCAIIPVCRMLRLQCRSGVGRLTSTLYPSGAMFDAGWRKPCHCWPAASPIRRKWKCAAGWLDFLGARVWPRHRSAARSRTPSGSSMTQRPAPA
jgi:PAS domain S-box-containing protein